VRGPRPERTGATRTRAVGSRWAAAQTSARACRPGTGGIPALVGTSPNSADGQHQVGSTSRALRGPRKSVPPGDGQAMPLVREQESVRAGRRSLAVHVQRAQSVTGLERATPGGQQRSASSSSRTSIPVWSARRASDWDYVWYERHTQVAICEARAPGRCPEPRSDLRPRRAMSRRTSRGPAAVMFVGGSAGTWTQYRVATARRAHGRSTL